MRIVRGPNIEAVWARHPPGHEPPGFVPYDTGYRTLEARILFNRFESRLLRAVLWLLYLWHEHVLFRVGRLGCRLLHRHNISCRGDRGHGPDHYPGGCNGWRDVPGRRLDLKERLRWATRRTGR
ncbi:hypothetical protein ACGFI9_21885 [Micromonospora sp. NPDC048930]|uniref:hypothetical protein n=1 Tax=Micromonospora sp. NPDC048930 TaxID=3364261 RepID=UPI003723DC39